ncbi:hypothetical protein ACVJGD_006267 [Bradyrhizobium sp. USDA 10063]
MTGKQRGRIRNHLTGLNTPFIWKVKPLNGLVNALVLGSVGFYRLS